jgi:hypothetical protein
LNASNESLRLDCSWFKEYSNHGCTHATLMPKLLLLQHLNVWYALCVVVKCIIIIILWL